ncbi:MAG: hypothetical protein E6J79_04370 [Deltaproteobacteria bacterium]|nr:MAG: hypothetical protein E6J79_04370 [Deltaproteobacteria bacterium]
MDALAARAAGVLAQVFLPLDVPIAFRLWDGTTTRVGPDDGGLTIVFHSRRAFRRLLLRPTSLRFGEAFIAGEVDIEGDVFAAAVAGNRLEQLRLPLGTRLALIASLLRP